MAYGESKHQLDDKYRLNIPRRFLHLFEHGGFLTRAYNGRSLVYYPITVWTELQKQLGSVKERLIAQDPALFLKAELATDTLTRFLSCGQDVSLDGQGRLTLPQSLRERAKLTKDVTLIGMGDRIEIWDTAIWEEYDRGLDPAAMGELLSTLSQRPGPATPMLV